MYDRAERTTNFFKSSSTGPNLGPANYYPKFDHPSCDCGGYAPFGSLAQRNTNLDPKKADAPPPSTYYPKDSLSKVKGGSTLRDKDTRFKDADNFVPGPGAHEIKLYWPESKKRHCKAPQPKILWRFVERTPPSIVATLDAHGYEAAPNGRLVPQKLICGPDFNPFSSVCMGAASCQQYRGCKWSQRTGKREIFDHLSDTPGPGSYLGPMQDEWICIILRGLYRNHINSQRVLHVPRFIEKVLQDDEHESVPAPGTYFEQLEVPVEENFRRPPFASSAERFTTLKTCTPAPCTYDVVKDKFDLACTLKNKNHVPFTTSDARLGRIEKFGSPEPWAYTLPGMADFVARRVRQKERGLKAPFDSSSERITMTGPRKATGPGPTDCQPSNTSSKPTLPAIISAFKDKSRPAKPKDIPPPNAYNVIPSFRALKNRKSFHVHRKTEPLDGFLGSDKRFNKFSEGLAQTEFIPGPGAYCIRRDPRPKPGSLVRTEERFKSMNNFLPGPADYTLAPSVGSGFWRKTYNVTLGKRAKSAPAPMKRQ